LYAGDRLGDRSLSLQAVVQVSWHWAFRDRICWYRTFYRKQIDRRVVSGRGEQI